MFRKNKMKDKSLQEFDLLKIICIQNEVILKLLMNEDKESIEQTIDTLNKFSKELGLT